MSNLRTLLKQSSHYVTGRTGVLLLGFVSFPVFTRIFTVAQYGTLSLVLKLLGLATILGKAGLQQSVLRFHQEHTVSGEQGRTQQFYSSIIFGVLMVSTLVAAIFFAGVSVMPESLVTANFKQPMRWGSIYIVIKASEAILWAFLRVEERTKLYNSLDIGIKAGTIALVSWILFHVETSVRAFVVGITLIEGVAVLGVCLLQISRGRLSPRAFRSDVFRTAFWFGMPLIGYEFAGMILDSGDRIMVEHFLGPQMLGYYSAAYNICTYIEEALMVPMGLALVPMYMKIWVGEGKEATSKFLEQALNTYVLAAALVASGAIVCARDLVILLGSRKLQESAQLLPMLVIGLLAYATYHFMNAGLLIHKKTGVMLRIVASASVLNIAINLVLIPRMQLQGAALATLISYLFLVSSLARASFRYLPLRINWVLWMKYVAAAAISGFAAAQIHFGVILINLAIKGCVIVLLYGLMLCAFDRQIRERVMLLRASRG